MKAISKNEILACEAMILQLRKCLVIYYKNHCFEEYRATLQDIQILKKELKRLNVAIGCEAKKGAAKNATVE